jgi:hypothetical protein
MGGHKVRHENRDNRHRCRKQQPKLKSRRHFWAL